ncbi:class I SAM-dependent methyltransferase [Methylomonas sp. MO1]|uniref:class I SAM-dependent methyltransferase n=1 Tax=Methylomonas sp. MO1 TaxID=3073619 RepID=UPI0028A4692D|nr:class I SAM-dependent methyltransferase [Methylomonas sp. MO1]MDT4291149.1 class I SAM-dependent methyltransferase [Methylomonas sp. MO1]
MSQTTVSREEAINANIYVHAFLANAGEYNKSPHFRPENKEKVRNILLRLTAACREKNKVIDFGCGTGFMIHLMHDLFGEVHGVDITQDMMKQVDLSSGNVTLHESMAESTPFSADTFDFATAYSFMDHLVDYRAFLQEAYRVLKKGGVFYSDLNPNRDFIMAIAGAEKLAGGVLPITPIVHREIQGALHNGEHYEEHYGMNAELLEKAEPIKTHDKGFSAVEVLEAARAIGFSDCRVEFEWFLGQAKVMHEQSRADADTVEQYLNAVLPVSSHLFKYLRFVFVK